MDTEEDEALKLSNSTSSLPVEGDGFDDDASLSNVTPKAAVVDSGDVVQQKGEMECRTELAAELNESRPVQEGMNEDVAQPPLVVNEGDSRDGDLAAVGGGDDIVEEIREVEADTEVEETALEAAERDYDRGEEDADMTEVREEEGDVVEELEENVEAHAEDAEVNEGVKEEADGIVEEMKKESDLVGEELKNESDLREETEEGTKFTEEVEAEADSAADVADAVELKGEVSTIDTDAGESGEGLGNELLVKEAEIKTETMELERGDVGQEMEEAEEHKGDELEKEDLVEETKEAEAVYDEMEKAHAPEEMERADVLEAAKGDVAEEMQQADAVDEETEEVEADAGPVDEETENVDIPEEVEEANAGAVYEETEKVNNREETEEADVGANAIDEEKVVFSEEKEESYANGVDEETQVADVPEETEEETDVGANPIDEETQKVDHYVEKEETDANGVDEETVDIPEETEEGGDVDVEMETADAPEETEEADDEEMEKVDVQVEMEDAYAVDEATDKSNVGNETDEAMDEEKEEEEEADAVDEETEKAEMVEEDLEVEEVKRTSGGKRKRGAKNPKSPGTRTPSKKKMEEDVCFICFDGGQLVLCDRRGCPKAYHPSCVNRDEAFFRTKGRWNCGWHLCSICEKNATYMCYTCTFSLCKGCIKDSVILCVRGNKGFCETCMKTVRLIEAKERGNKENDQVDFDDKGSWEYLFKDYWIDLKGRLSLSLDDLESAKNPWKGSGKQDLADGDYDVNKDAGQDSDSSAHAEAPVSKRRKSKKQAKSRAKDNDSSKLMAATGAGGASSDENIEWASPELLELVMHMRNGDKSVLSQFEVQTLLLAYIKKYKLRDPSKRTHVICDGRLQILFGKPRVGHFEMLKLLESHFLMREETHADDLQESIVDNEANQLEAGGNFDALIKGGKDKKRKSRRKGDGRGLQSNLDDYAAIDMHNINLIYLRRNLVEELLEDTETFHDKVVGAFARIRISGNVQKQDLYRLVQVVGTSKVAEPYKVGKRTTDILLETLNLNKTELVSIDIISNQEFTEDECKRLRQSIKCGLINRLTVGDIQEKAIALQAVRVNDWLESEIMRLSHLRDRASDMGRRKELRECVEKLQLLKTPEERQRRMEEIPEIHADPNMDPSYVSEEEDAEPEKQESSLRPRGSSFSRRGREPISPRSTSNDYFSGNRSYSSGHKELSRSLSNKGKGDDYGAGEILNENSWSHGREKEMQPLNSWEKPKSALNLETGARNSPNLGAVKSESFIRAAAESSPAPSATGITQSGPKINESEKIWHYKDPSGKVQGPFSIVQLRKWNNTGYFPANLRIWKSSDKPEDSYLLTDALAGKFYRDPPVVDAGFSKPHTVPYVGKPHGLSLQQGQIGGGSNFDHNRQASNPSSIEVHKPGWGTSETNLPSPTPRRTFDKVKTFEKEWSPTPFQPSSTPLTASKSSGIGGLNMSHGATSESLRLPVNVHQQPASTSVASINPSVDLKNIAASLQSLVQQTKTPGETHGWGSGSISRPEMISPTPKHGGMSQTWGNVPPQKSESNNLAPIPAQASAQAFAQSQATTFGNPSGVYPVQVPNTMQSSESWRPHVPGHSNVQLSTQPHSNVQLSTQPNQPWGAAPPILNPMPRQGQENHNTGWGPMPGNPNMGWAGQQQVPANTNMNWGNPGQQVQAPHGNANTGWAAPGQMQAQAPSSWAPPAQGPTPMNTTPAWSAGGQGPPPGNQNSGWGAPASAPAPSNNPNMWGNSPNSSQRDRSSQGGDSGYGGGRPWNRQSSFGNNRGGDSSRPPFNKGQRICKYHESGHCKKGSHCDYLHS